MFAPQEEYHEDRAEPLIILFRVLSRRDWDELQSWYRAFPGSRIEHLLEGTGFFVLIIEPLGSEAG